MDNSAQSAWDDTDSLTKMHPGDFKQYVGRLRDAVRLAGGQIAKDEEEDDRVGVSTQPGEETALQSSLNVALKAASELAPAVSALVDAIRIRATGRELTREEAGVQKIVPEELSTVNTIGIALRGLGLQLDAYFETLK